MKFENFARVKELVDSINSLETTFNKLQIHGLTLFINNSFDKIYTIGLDPNSEHQYAQAGRILIESIKDDLRSRIDKKLEELEQL